MTKPKPLTIEATVRWFDGQDHPSVSPETIKIPEPLGPENQVEIHWKADIKEVTHFRILGLDPAQFTPTHSPQKSHPGPKEWTTDFTTTLGNTRGGGWAYFVEAERVSPPGSAPLIGRHDPRIENGGGGGGPV